MTTLVHWTEAGETCSARWRSESGAPAPKRVQIADDTLSADAAFRLTSEGTALLWRGDFQNARQLLQAIGRRIDKPRKPKKPPVVSSSLDVFNLHRQAQSQRARTLSMLVLQFDGAHHLALRRAPQVMLACGEVYGAGDAAQGSYLASMRELLGLISAHEWRKKGVAIAALDGAQIHPHYGVFSPLRGEYLALVAKAPLPSALKSDSTAFDIGTGTGVLAAILAQRGVQRVLATDQDPRALVCARENLQRLGLTGRVELYEVNMFPDGRAPLIVCNPPWVPARPSSPMEHAVYDPDSRMLRGFLNGLADHLTPGGEGWLILSDLAEHLGMRPRTDLLAWVEAAGLQVLSRTDTRPEHHKVRDATDALHAARAAEITSLWRLGVRGAA